MQRNINLTTKNISRKINKEQKESTANDKIETFS